MKLLLLAGTTEARALAERLARDRRLEVQASLAGATRAPVPLGVATRTGGFGGELEQEKYITDNGFGAVIDATHPFAIRISRRTQVICDRLDLPYLQLIRPGWQPGPGDNWTFLDREEDAAAHVPERATVFLATGRKTLDRFAPLQGRRVICRRIDPAAGPFPFPGGEFLIGRPPFSVEDEIRLFRELGVDVLVVKDAGGPVQEKLIAARDLGLPVLVIRRPEQPPGPKAESVEAALDWLDRLL